MRITENRKDITDWLIHFVHDRNVENDMYQTYLKIGEEIEMSIPPRSFDFDGNPDFNYSYDDLDEKYYDWYDDEPAFGVLLKVIKDGFLKSTWSYRNYKSSVYGPKPVVCFTEMPLYGLINYVKNRNQNELTTSYGIAFLKSEAFEAGARPVIYGLSSKYEETEEGDPFFGKGLRTLASKCGIGLREQYRYVSTNLTKKYPIDWTHEREWRWADLDYDFSFPGLPFFISNANFSFSKIIVIVYTDAEAEQILNLLKSHHDSRQTNYGYDLSKEAIKNTLILSIESLERDFKTEDIRLDDLPFFSLPKIKEIVPSQECIDKVTEVWRRANVISFEAASKAFKETPEEKHWTTFGPCGGAILNTYNSHSEVTQAFIQLGIATAYTDHYSLGGLNTVPTQLVGITEIGVRAAAEYLTKELEQKFYWRTYID